MSNAPSNERPGRNALLRALPPDERSLLDGVMEPVDLGYRLILQELDQPLSHLWFPHSGVCSLLSQMADGAMVEVATIGREGMVGLPVVLDSNRSPQRTLVQIPGVGDRLEAGIFRELRERTPALNALLLRYALSLVTQIAQGSACNRLHPIEARCARWLLLTHDRVDGDSFVLTHEFLAQMLGMTRPSVTVAAGMLHKAGLIRYIRGRIDILDRSGLEQAACECYALITGEFRRLVSAP